MADETFTPQAGDLWLLKDGEPVWVVLRDGDLLATFSDGTHGNVTGRFPGETLLVFRDGKPYQPPTQSQGGDLCKKCGQEFPNHQIGCGQLFPSQGGDVITVEIVVAGEPGKRRIGWEEGETVEKQLNWARQCGLHPHDCTIRAALPVRTTPLIEGAVELPPVTATPS